MTAYSPKDACPHCHASDSTPPALLGSAPVSPGVPGESLAAVAPMIPCTGWPVFLQRFPEAGARSPIWAGPSLHHGSLAKVGG